MIVKIADGVEILWIEDIQIGIRGFFDKCGFQYTLSQVNQICDDAIQRGLTTKERLHEEFAKVIIGAACP